MSETNSTFTNGEIERKKIWNTHSNNHMEVGVNGASVADKMDASSQVKCYGRNDRRVLVIYTGGTIGMVYNKEGGEFCFCK